MISVLRRSFDGRARELIDATILVDFRPYADGLIHGYRHSLISTIFRAMNFRKIERRLCVAMEYQVKLPVWTIR